MQTGIGAQSFSLFIAVKLLGPIPGSIARYFRKPAIAK
jgi:hypothetical protein